MDTVFQSMQEGKNNISIWKGTMCGYFGGVKTDVSFGVRTQEFQRLATGEWGNGSDNGNYCRETSLDTHASISRPNNNQKDGRRGKTHNNSSCGRSSMHHCHCNRCTVATSSNHMQWHCAILILSDKKCALNLVSLRLGGPGYATT